ncbi:type 1 fimbrial protein [Erwinia endophytica]|uniref:fimbrial protein n=1 Tax=Erwinia endophytica TaxID=1563158 RepID=UPI001265EBE5|nr:fimbrial protein [Erwinia endophytica]KAB8312454.1 type 1 fimbrial protein [Erwinia endophytica]
MTMKLKNEKSNTVLIGALAVFVCGMSVNTYATTDTASITITGTVIANTCTIDNDSATQAISLTPIADRDIKGVGTTGGAKKVNIVLKDCGEGASAVKVTASGEADGSEFKNTYAGTEQAATGGGLRFLETDSKTAFTPDGKTTETSTLTPSSDNTLIYTAEYVGTADKVTAGEFETVVNMTFEYQ